LDENADGYDGGNVAGNVAENDDGKEAGYAGGAK
jgi:hypothetical protein